MIKKLYFLHYNFKRKTTSMKQLLFSAFTLCAFVACNNATTSTETSKDTATTSIAAASTEPVTYAYTPNYSGDFEIGDSKNAQLILEIWKDYDNNTLDNHRDAFADSVTFDLAGGTSITGPRDSVLNGIKQYRGGFVSAVSTVEVVTALKAKGKDESWVCVWGKEVDVNKKNKKDSIYLNENWMFNKDGKIAYMAQYQATPPVKK